MKTCPEPNRRIIQTSNAPAAIGPYSQAIEKDGFLFCSGQIALTPEGKFIGGNVSEQTQQILKNISGVLSAAGLNFANVVKTTIFLTDISDFEAVNEIYGETFSESPPARSTVAVAALPKNAKVEIEVIAKK